MHLHVHVDAFNELANKFPVLNVQFVDLQLQHTHSHKMKI